jgi:hypothetical protein
MKSGAIDLVVIDSVAALVPQAELDGEMSDSSVGLQARLMSKAMRKLAGVMNRSQTARPSSSTSCVKRSASCSAIRRQRRAAGR